MAPLAGISPLTRAVSLYDRQQFYANRLGRVKAPATYQVGAADRVDLSAEAVSRAAGAAPEKAEAAITYESLRKSAGSDRGRTGGPSEREEPLSPAAPVI